VVQHLVDNRSLLPSKSPEAKAILTETEAAEAAEAGRLEAEHAQAERDAAAAAAAKK
jgi:hypothetical protein